jgi:hypothetical protein
MNGRRTAHGPLNAPAGFIDARLGIAGTAIIVVVDFDEI